MISWWWTLISFSAGAILMAVSIERLRAWAWAAESDLEERRKRDGDNTFYDYDAPGGVRVIKWVVPLGLVIILIKRELRRL